MVTTSQEIFEATTSVHHFSGNYERALSDVISGSNQVMGTLGSWATNFEYSGMDLSDFLARRTEMIGDTLSDTSRRIGSIISVAPDVLYDLSDLTDYEYQVYQDVVGVFETFRHSAIYDINKKVGSPLVRSAIRIALDDTVYSSARNVFEVSPAAGSYHIDKGASSSVSLKAMMLGLDDLVYAVGYSTARHSRAASRHYFERHASTPRVSEAMKTGIDGLVYESARGLSGNFAMPTRQIHADASSPEAAQIIINNLSARRASAGEQSGRPRRSGSEWSERVRQAKTGSTPPPREEPRREEPRREAPREEPKAQPKAEQKQSPKEKTPYELLMADLRKTDRSMFETIRGFDEKEVAKVIATVKHLREKDSDITDKQIALRYARASNRDRDVSAERKRATQIVMALMGNKISGELPF